MALVGLAACSSETSTGTVSGTLSMTGGPAPGVSIPVAGTVTLARSSAAQYEDESHPTGSTVEVPVGEDGTFSIDVPAGRYEVGGTSPSFGDSAYQCSGVVVRVTGTSPASADVVCHMR